ncbi:MAG: type II toxin-antitoxin system RelE/ParE family toxin [Bacteroidales bacterium]|nr:type II toxin-antitoxin system RelE/ParE family toxin [Bacteroidales bacterium]
MPKVRFSNKAVEDLTSIWRYTVNEWSEKQADEYYEMLITSCNRLLSYSVLLNRSYEEIAENLYGVKAGHHIIFYQPLNEGDIYVVRILHEKMDIKSRLTMKK